jgi:hypothetical protein
MVFLKKKSQVVLFGIPLARVVLPVKNSPNEAKISFTPKYKTEYSSVTDTLLSPSSSSVPPSTLRVHRCSLGRSSASSIGDAI